jgi:hypothetical protein
VVTYKRVANPFSGVDRATRVAGISQYQKDYDGVSSSDTSVVV